MRAHGCIDATGAARSWVASLDHVAVQRLAHAVQTLKFIAARAIGFSTGKRFDGGHGLGVMCGELRVDGVGRGQQLTGAGDIGQVRVVLARVDRVVGQAVDLRALDFAVPVGPLDQAHHQASAAAPGQINQIVDHIGAALLIGLNHKAQTVPACEAGGVGQLLQQVQRQLQPLGFFGVDIESDVVAACQLAQLQHAWQQLIHHALPLRAAVAWVQGAELDGNAGPFVDAQARSRLADGVNRIHIGLQIALSILRGQRGFAQHVVGIAKPLGLQLARALQSLANGLAHHELLAHETHGHIHAFAHQWLAAAGRQALERREQARFAMRVDQLAGNHEAPCGRVDEERRAFAQMSLPVAATQLVADQRVACAVIGDAQQCLGQTHQRHALLRGQ